MLVFLLIFKLFLLIGHGLLALWGEYEAHLSLGCKNKLIKFMYFYSIVK